MKQLPLLIAFLTFSLNLAGEELTQEIEKYNAQRSELIAETRANYFADHLSLTEEEQKVDAYLKTLQVEASEKFPYSHSQNYLKNQKEVEKSRLFLFLQQMPKGAILHLHAPAIGDLDWFIKRAITHPCCYIYTGESKGKCRPGALGIFYNPPEDNCWKPVQSLRQQSEDVSAFDAKLYESCTMHWRDSENPQVWDKFYSCFMHYRHLFSNMHLYMAFVKDALIQLIQKEHVQHVELRDSPSGKHVAMFQEILLQIQREHPDFTLKIIYQISRTHNREEFLTRGKEALLLRKCYPELIVGFDLAGEEDSGHPTNFYVEEFLQLKRLAAQEGVSLPCYFHGGESSQISNENLYDILLLHSKRVGHGLNLIKNPLLMEKFKQADIAIEVCPISNQILGFVSDMRNHPAVTYLNAGLPVTISPDDPGVFGYAGVTPDFWEACHGWQLDLRALKQLAVNSIKYSALNDSEKETALNQWQQKWDAFISETSDAITTGA